MTSLYVILSISVLAVYGGDVRVSQCQVKEDTVFVLDMSGSIKSPNFTIMLQICKEIVHDVGFSANLYGLDVFSTNSYTRFKMNKHTTEPALFTAIDNVSYGGGGTNTYKAFERLIYYSFTTSYGHRPGVHKVAIIMTDGKSSDRERTIKAANRAKAEGIFIKAIGIGDIDWNELLAYSSPGYAFKVRDFEALRTFDVKKLATPRRC